MLAYPSPGFVAAACSFVIVTVATSEVERIHSSSATINCRNVTARLALTRAAPRGAGYGIHVSVVDIEGLRPQTDSGRRFAHKEEEFHEALAILVCVFAAFQGG